MTIVESGPHGPLTAEQHDAVERRDGRLLVTANAGAGKTLVLVERFVRDVVETADGEDPIGCDQILAITFTRKAAGELRARIRRRFRDLGQDDQARELERAWILTIDGFCTRVLRAHAVLAGLDPQFTVLDPSQARTLREEAFAQALDDWLGDDAQPRAEALHVLAAHGYDGLRDAIIEIYERLRSAGHERPSIPRQQPPDREHALAAFVAAARHALAELQAAGASGKTVDRVAAELRDCVDGSALTGSLTPERVRALYLPRTAGALKTDAFDDCRAAREALTQAIEDELGLPQLLLIGDLLERFGAAFRSCKRHADSLDFTDLALRTRALLREHPAVAAGYRGRLRRVMVDEFQDTNALQMSLIEALGIEHVFFVGDALQSIYRFRDADVSVFLKALRESEDADSNLALSANFRSRREILGVINAAFSEAHGNVPWTPLTVPELEQPDDGADKPAQGDGPPVELLLTDEPAWNDAEGLREQLLAGLPPSTRPAVAAEALIVAQRVREIVDSGEADAGEIVVLVRTGSQLALFERAIERAGLPAVAAQGRGWWARLEVLDLIAHLRLLVNPSDEAGLFGALSAFADVSADTLALLALDRDRTRRGGDGWATLSDSLERAVAGPASDSLLAAIEPSERERLRCFSELLDRERAAVGWAGPGELIGRVVAATGNDRATLRRPGGARRLANVRKLTRLAHEFERTHGGDLRAFVDRAAAELESGAPTTDAPVEVGTGNVVRLMTIHASKGLEFPVVVVADLGRRPPTRVPRVLVDGDRAGLRVTTLDRQAFTALGYDELKKARADGDRGEERRVVHVAVTRARRRLILSGAADLDPGRGWETNGAAVPLMRWIAPLMLDPATLGRLSGDLVDESCTIERGPARGELRVVVNAPRTVGSVLRLEPAAGDDEPGAPAPAPGRPDASAGGQMYLDRLIEHGEKPERPLPAPPVAGSPPPAPATVSYSSLTSYAQCGYRWYLTRSLRLPAREAWDLRGSIPDDIGEAARARGSLAHLLLERQPLRPGTAGPDGETVRALALEVGGGELDEEQVADQQRLVGAFLDGPLFARVAGARLVRREVGFALALDPGNAAVPLLTGSIDLLAEEGDGAQLVVDYKTDRVAADADLEGAVARDYALQRAAYALAALRAGATRVEVVHLYLERPQEPVSVRYTDADAPALTSVLEGAARGMGEGRFEVSDRPYAGLCATCPGRGGLCSHPDELTSRPDPL